MEGIAVASVIRAWNEFALTYWNGFVLHSGAARNVGCFLRIAWIIIAGRRPMKILWDGPDEYASGPCSWIRSLKPDAWAVPLEIDVGNIISEIIRHIMATAKTSELDVSMLCRLS